MTDGTTTRRIELLVGRMREGDAEAQQELMSAACLRLKKIVHVMLRGYPRLLSVVEEDDVLQQCALRMYESLPKTKLESARHFFNWMSLQIQRECIDLIRHFFGKRGFGTRFVGGLGSGDASSETARGKWNPGESTDDPGKLAQWTEFHCAVDKLPEELQEVFRLLWYAGLTRGEAAEQLEVSEPTIQSRYRRAKRQLVQMCEEDDESRKRSRPGRTSR